MSARQARVAILFSGGLDCATLALLASTVLPPSESIDLINVAFENPRITSNKPAEDIYEVPDRQTARATYVELCRLQPDRKWNLVLVNINQEESLNSQNDVLDLMAPQDTEMDLVRPRQGVHQNIAKTTHPEPGYRLEQSHSRPRCSSRHSRALSFYSAHFVEWTRG